MHPRILHIYGPLWVNSYGVMIALGLLAFLLCTINHPTRKKYFTIDQYFNAVFVGLLSGVAGGRLLYVLTHLDEFIGNWLSAFYFWEPGLFVLGSFLAILLIASLYFRYHKIPALPVFDMVAVYAPLFQVIARIGCLLAGCCYGAYAPNLPFAITFTNPDGCAPLFTPLHPTQLYTSLLALVTFLIMYTVQNKLARTAGLLTCLFLIFENASRFIIDFWRDDREFFTQSTLPSLNQLSQAQVLALACLIVSSLAFLALWYRNKK